ncbi:DUF5615 family PIN-like protein [Luteolibacter arcticus]|uniref:DUF5615 family PIN-like protein n=1 Tax=Luteolibacter arcticus TaxID=1581411 RepID=A0ABT3GNP8_9BACT|nr:DUF5615 family PIN-like protein [Luteolibacter arcticus]MCW1925085.1 DUF5615 family PIN-like protein [Luteolibacter arcticus]
MRFLLDENFPNSAVGFLEALAHEAHDFRGTAEEGMEDGGVFAKAQDLNAVLLTTDRDFFHTVPHLFSSHAGVVVVAMKQSCRATILSRLEWIIAKVNAEDFANRVFQLRDRSWLAYPALERPASE